MKQLGTDITHSMRIEQNDVCSFTSGLEKEF